MYFNDLGCIHFQLQKYNLAAFYFRKALQENNKALSSLPVIDKSMFVRLLRFLCCMGCVHLNFQLRKLVNHGCRRSGNGQVKKSSRSGKIYIYGSGKREVLRVNIFFIFPLFLLFSNILNSFVYFTDMNHFVLVDYCSLK